MKLLRDFIWSTSLFPLLFRASREKLCFILILRALLIYRVFCFWEPGPLLLLLTQRQGVSGAPSPHPSTVWPPALIRWNFNLMGAIPGLALLAKERRTGVIHHHNPKMICQVAKGPPWQSPRVRGPKRTGGLLNGDLMRNDAIPAKFFVRIIYCSHCSHVRTHYHILCFSFDPLSKTIHNKIQIVLRWNYDMKPLYIRRLIHSGIVRVLSLMITW